MKLNLVIWSHLVTPGHTPGHTVSQLQYLTSAMAYLDKQLQEKNKYNVFLAIGLLAVAVGEDIESHLKNVLAHIKLNLPSKDATAAANKKRSAALDPAIFACVSMLACAVRHKIKNEVGNRLYFTLYNRLKIYHAHFDKNTEKKVRFLKGLIMQCARVININPHLYLALVLRHW